MAVYYYQPAYPRSYTVVAVEQPSKYPATSNMGAAGAGGGAGGAGPQPMIVERDRSCCGTDPATCCIITFVIVLIFLLVLGIALGSHYSRRRCGHIQRCNVLGVCHTHHECWYD